MPTPGPGNGAGALAGILEANGGPVTDQERADQGALPAAANGKPKDFVPWRAASTPTQKSVEKWREGTYGPGVRTYPRMGADERAALEAPDPRLATEAEKAAGMFDPGTGFGLNDMEKRQAAYDKQRGQALPILKDPAEVANAILSMTPEELKVITDKMVDRGMIDENFNMTDVKNAWTTLVGDAIDWHRANPDQMMTPVDMIDLMHGDGATGEGKGPSSVDVISKTRTISTNDQARSMLRQMMAANLGRRPTQLEVDDFQASLNEAQRNNPQVNTTTHQLNAAGNQTGSSTVITGGMDQGDADDFAYEATVDTDPDSEYGKYQQATTYYNSFLNAIRGPGGS